MKIRREIKSKMLWNILTLYFDIKIVFLFLSKAIIAKLRRDLESCNTNMAILIIHWTMSSQLVKFETKNYIFSHQENEIQ